MFNEKWNRRFAELARHVATWSRDPSTKVGAVIVDQERHPISLGYNGLPKEMLDDEKILNNREEKYKYVIHAERNAIANSPSSVEGCTMYVTHPCCSACAEFIAKSGISTVVWIHNKEFSDRWNSTDAEVIFKQNKVNIIILSEE